MGHDKTLRNVDDFGGLERRNYAHGCRVEQPNTEDCEDDLLGPHERKAQYCQSEVDYAVEQMEDLLYHGVSGIHLYTMNQAETAAIITERIRPKLCVVNGGQP